MEWPRVVATNQHTRANLFVHSRQTFHRARVDLELLREHPEQLRARDGIVRLREVDEAAEQGLASDPCTLKGNLNNEAVVVHAVSGSEARLASRASRMWVCTESRSHYLAE